MKQFSSTWGYQFFIPAGHFLKIQEVVDSKVVWNGSNWSELTKKVLTFKHAKVISTRA